MSMWEPMDGNWLFQGFYPFVIIQVIQNYVWLHNIYEYESQLAVKCTYSTIGIANSTAPHKTDIVGSMDIQRSRDLM